MKILFFSGTSIFKPSCAQFLFIAKLLFIVMSISVFGQDAVPEKVLSAKTTESLPTAKIATVTAPSQSKMKVTFDEKSPGVVYIESNGEKIRVDTTKRTVDELEGLADQEQTGERAAAPDKAEKEEEESKYDFDRGEEPYDHRVVNIPTPKSIPKGSWNLIFNHRFSEPVRPVRDSARDLLGLDSFGIASFGLTYGVTDRLYVSAYRSPLCQRGLCKVIELGAGYNWIAADKHSPIGLSTYASIEGNDNFTEEFTYNLQAMISGRLGKRVYLFFSPAVHINSNGQRRFDPRPTDFFPPAALASTFRQPTHTASFGFGASVLLTPNVAALFDFVPRTGFKLGQVTPVLDSNFRIIGFTTESHPTLGFGIQRNIGRHAFALTFSNTQGTTTSRYNSSTLIFSPKHFTIGFNLSRRF
jgi:Membrane bound beta barrel domain (DUF5777)